MANFVANSFEDILKSFPTHKISKVEGRPMYEKLKPIIKELHKCAIAIPLNENRRHLHLTTTDVQYWTITGNAKTIPVKPPALAPITTTMTQYQLQHCQVNHKEQM